VLFVGTVREDTWPDGRTVVALEYEAYEEMALEKLRSLTEELKQKWKAQKVALVHRLGRVPVGEVSVAVAVSAAHRAEAFAAAQEAMNRLKLEVPIWKKEVASDGSKHWVRLSGSSTPDSDRDAGNTSRP